MQRGGAGVGRGSRAWWLLGPQLVACSLFVAGCYESHRLPESDAGRQQDVGAPADAGPHLDVGAGQPDAALDAATEPDAGAGCAPEGAYEVPVTVESMVPAGCVDAQETVTFLFPFELNFVGGCGGAGVPLVPIGDCVWSFSCVSDEIVPGVAYEGHGVLGIGPAGVFGRVEETWVYEGNGACEGAAILGDGLPP